MESFVCTNCGYRFSSEKGNSKKCPYCNGENIEKEKSAEELVDNIKVE